MAMLLGLEVGVVLVVVGIVVSVGKVSVLTVVVLVVLAFAAVLVVVPLFEARLLVVDGIAVNVTKGVLTVLVLVNPGIIVVVLKA